MRCILSTVLIPAALFGLVGISSGQVVQLPTFRSFGMSTSVVVPDRGAVYMGGNGRAATGWNEFGSPLGPFNNRGLGMLHSAGAVSVSAYVHDFAAMDAYLLSQASGNRTAESPPASTSALQRASASSATQAVRSVAELRAEHAAEADWLHEVSELLRRGQAAERAGKIGAARLYYQMAARRAADPERDKILAKVAELDTRSGRSFSR